MSLSGVVYCTLLACLCYVLSEFTQNKLKHNAKLVHICTSRYLDLERFSGSGDSLADFADLFDLACDADRDRDDLAGYNQMHINVVTK